MRRALFAIVGTAVGLVLLLSFKTHTGGAVATSPPAAIGSPSPSARPSPSPSAGAGSSAGSGSSGSSGSGDSSSTSKTVTGSAADTRYGPVQVRITVTNGQLTAVDAVDYPQQDPRDQQINAFAIPELNQEALAAKSARIDTISGATYTSEGYIASLQSALDQAGG